MAGPLARRTSKRVTSKHACQPWASLGCSFRYGYSLGLAQPLRWRVVHRGRGRIRQSPSRTGTTARPTFPAEQGISGRRLGAASDFAITAGMTNSESNPPDSTSRLCNPSSDFQSDATCTDGFSSDGLNPSDASLGFNPSLLNPSVQVASDWKSLDGLQSRLVESGGFDSEFVMPAVIAKSLAAPSLRPDIPCSAGNVGRAVVPVRDGDCRIRPRPR